VAGVLVIDDDAKICQLLGRIIGEMGHEVRQASTLRAGLEQVARGGLDVVFLDLALPDGSGLSALPDIMAAPSAPEVVIVTGTGDRSGAELAFKSGAWDYIQKPFLPEDVALPLTRALQYRQEKMTGERPKFLRREGIIGDSTPIKACFELVAQAAGTDASVLISGETGTGKELFARAIHHNSSRAGANFVVVDCTALPETLVESTLFGHEKGAFTGADRGRDGLIKQADGGTLFLDEIGELPLTIQKSFLRVLQEHRFRALGSSHEKESNFRLIAATNRDLQTMAAQGSFRQDLLYRVRSLTINLPPLRQRRDDVKALVIHQVAQICDHWGMETKGISPEFLQALQTYDWPGNVRELINTLESALASAATSPTLYHKHLPPAIRLRQLREPEVEPSSPGIEAAEDQSLEGDLPALKEYRDSIIAEAERKYLIELMRRTRGSIKEALRLSGLSPSRLHALLKKYDTPRFRGD